MNLGHGGNVEEIGRKYNVEEKDIIDFSANINPLGICSNVRAEMIKALDKVERYPDITYHDLKKGISFYENIDNNNIFLGNGAAEVIFNIVRGLKPKKVLLPAPTFSEYEDAVKSIGAKVNYHMLKDEFLLGEKFILDINEDIDMVFICNPNNPTGVLTSKEYILKVLKRAKKYSAMVIMDESFIDFIEDKKRYSTIDLLKDYDNLILVKSLTKFFAFPGIRVGYGISYNSLLVNRVNNVSIPWSVNTIANYGAIRALKEKEYMKKTVHYVKEEKKFLYKALSSFKELSLYNPSVNFIFLKVNKEIDLKEALIKEGILIRSCDNYVGLSKEYYRVAVRTRKENIKLIEGLKKVFK